MFDTLCYVALIIMRFHVNKWNKRDKDHTMLILTEEDIENESDKHKGAGYEILILPSKYKDIHSQYLDTVRMLATARCGEVIYV
jgi:nitrate reductase alpha subunit